MFFKHPPLRYGGYHLIALMAFIPLSIYLSKLNLFSKIVKRAFLIVTVINFYLEKWNKAER